MESVSGQDELAPRPETAPNGFGFEPGGVVVVTGGSSGIGRATAAICARAGLRVAIWDLDTDAARKVAVDIVECDVTSREQVSRAFTQTATFGPPAYLVNNAGPASFGAMRVSDGVAAVLEATAGVTELWLQEFSDVAASVVFTSSVAGNFSAGASNNLWYPVAKAAMASYMREIAASNLGHPRSNAVAPGVIVTPRNEAYRQSAAATATLTRHPLRRFGLAEEVASVICFLLSPAASYVNGVTVPVDGGWMWTTC
jgi:NAD(P)-dependent dehydrogenase (short-subunit alcohol dehydrogenase family)